MSSNQTYGRARARTHRFGIATALAAATFLSGVGLPAAARAQQTVAANHSSGIAGDSNGVYHSPVLNRAVPDTSLGGTAINWVSGVFNDDAAVFGDWDLTFWNVGPDNTFAFFPIATYQNAVVVSGTTAAVLEAGVTIGPESTFSATSANVDPDPAWFAGADAYIGFKFNCDGRLTHPVAGGVCYGYAHLTTTESATGFPATVVEYSFDGDGHPITIVPTETFTVTPSVGTPSGTITPAAPQTVLSGATASFTLAADAGFRLDLDGVGGTCGGTLVGNVYTTDAVTADCTVIANFTAGEVAPVISVTPSPVAISVVAGKRATATLTVANSGVGTLNYAIVETPMAAAATSYLTARRARASNKAAMHMLAPAAGSGPTRGAASLSHRGAAVLGDLQISQMQDNTPDNNTIGCSADDGTSVSENSWWRRFYFSEHAGIGATATIASVTITSGSTAAGPAVDLPVTINLYSIAHSTPVDTIPTAALTLIGSGTGTISGGFQVVTIPVVGSVDDTAGKDLVVEYHTEGNADTQGGTFFPGSNSTPETHPTFVSSASCGWNEPMTTAAIGLEAHMPLIVTLAAGDPQPVCANSGNQPWLSVTPASGVLAGGASADSVVMANATILDAGSYSANLCVSSNDTTNPVVTIPVNVTVTPGTCSSADTVFCDDFDGDLPSADIIDSGTISLAIPQTSDGIGIGWINGFTCTDGSCLEEFITYALDGKGGLHFSFPLFETGVEGGVGNAAARTYTLLAPGDSVGPDSEFIADAALADMTLWQAGVDGYLGFKFYCEQLASSTCYGYALLSTNAPLGFPATLVRYWYNVNGDPITIR